MIKYQILLSKSKMALIIKGLSELSVMDGRTGIMGVYYYKSPCDGKKNFLKQKKILTDI